MPYHSAGDGTRLFYKDLGAGAPVVLVHAWSLSSAMWEYQTVALAEAGHRVVALDRRGHGRSDVPGVGYEFDRLADDLHGLFTALDLTGVTLVGHSTGTNEITRYLTRHGTGRVTRAAYVGAMTPHLAGAVGEVFVDSVIADLRADRPGWFRDGVDGYFALPGSGTSRATVDDGLVQILATPLEVQVALFRAMATTDMTAELRRIDIPTLVVHGDADQSAPIDITGRPTAAALPQSRFVVYPGAGHGLYVTEKDRLNSDLLDFIDEGER